MFFRQLSNAFSYLDLLDNVATILGPECRIFSRLIRIMDALRVIHPKPADWCFPALQFTLRFILWTMIGAILQSYLPSCTQLMRVHRIGT